MPPLRNSAPIISSVSGNGDIDQCNAAVPPLDIPPPLLVGALLFEITEFFKISVPLLLTAPEFPSVAVTPEMVAVTPPSITRTVLLLPASRVSPVFGPTMFVASDVLLSSKAMPLSTIVCSEANTVESNVIVVGVVLPLAVVMALRRLIKPLLGGNNESITVFTTTLVSSVRLSSDSITLRDK